MKRTAHLTRLGGLERRAEEAEAVAGTADLDAKGAEIERLDGESQQRDAALTVKVQQLREYAKQELAALTELGQRSGGLDYTIRHQAGEGGTYPNNTRGARGGSPGTS